MKFLLFLKIIVLTKIFAFPLKIGGHATNATNQEKVGCTKNFLDQLFVSFQSVLDSGSVVALRAGCFNKKLTFERMQKWTWPSTFIDPPKFLAAHIFLSILATHSFLTLLASLGPEP